MTIEELIHNILAFLNFPEEATFIDIRNFLLEKNLCRFALIVGDDKDNHYSLFSKDEILASQSQGLAVSLPLSQATCIINETQTPTLLADPAYYQKRVIFPATATATTTAPGPGDEGDTLPQAFRNVIRWFQTFMLGCSAGVMDVPTLNRFKSTRKMVLEFKQTKDSMNPILSPVEMLEDGMDEPLEQKILSSWIYPFIFMNSGGTLAKIRRCRQCGNFFKGARLHATFCTTKCRMGWNYANHA